MAWDTTTNFQQAGFRELAAFKAARNLGCVLMFKPWLFVIGVERWERGGAIYLGPLAAGFGPIDD